MENTYSEKIANAVRDFFKQNDWHFDFDPEKGIFHYVIRAHHCKLQTIRSDVDVHDDFFMVYAYCPIKADPQDKDMMNKVNEFLSRANYGMVKGNFEFDFRDGEVRYKVYCKYPVDEAPSDEFLAYNIFCPCKQLEAYTDGLLGVMFGGMSAKDAVDKCEKQYLLRLLNELQTDDSSDGSAPCTDKSDADADADADGNINFNLFDSDDNEGGNE